MGISSLIMRVAMLRRREYNRRVREVVEASWLASSAAEAPEPALENGHAAQQQQQPEAAAAEGAAEQAAEAADAAAEPQAKRQKVGESAADQQQGSEAQAI